MKKFFFVVCFFIVVLLPVLVSHAQQGKVHYTSTKIMQPPAEGAEVRYTYKVFKNNDGSFGYEILANDSTYFYQPNYPGRTEGFSEKETCETIATLIIRKISSGQMIPAVSDRELAAYNIKK